jgi:pyroglutamyl-peptidase
MTTVLVTGFEPFAGSSTNPSDSAVGLLGASWRGRARLVTAILPVEFERATKKVFDLVDEHAPAVVIATGLAGGRHAVSVERVALNLRDASIPDNSGAQPSDRPCIEGAPTAYFSSLPVKAIARDIAARGIPSELSLTSGSFVCNQVFFAVSHVAATTPGVRVGFIHVPWDDEHAPEGKSSIPLASIVSALDIAVATTLANSLDIDSPGGALH